MSQTPSRRQFLRDTAIAGASASLAMSLGQAAFAQDAAAQPAAEPLYKISLAEYSLHRMIQQGQLDPLNFGPYTKDTFGIEAIELWNSPFGDKAEDKAYMGEMKKKAEDAGVQRLLIMIDGEGNLGDPNIQRRIRAVDNHKKWVVAAKEMGCHSIRVNAASSGTPEEQHNYAVDGLRQLSQFGDALDINIIVENHGGLSSNGEWLSGVIKAVGLENCGTLPDFGNFNIGRGQSYDNYKGIEELMPYAKGVSAKSYDFDDEGNEARLDFRRIMKIVVDAGYHGFVGIEFEGGGSEVDGIKNTQALLEKIRSEMTAAA